MVRAAKILAFSGALLFAAAGAVQLYFTVAPWFNDEKAPQEDVGFAVEELDPFPAILEPAKPEGDADEAKPFLRKVGFDALPSFENDNFIEVLPAFVHSCKAILKKPKDAPLLFGSEEFGFVKDWVEVCGEIIAFKGDNDALKALLKEKFQPFAVDGKGLFTGYYEAGIKGSYKKSAKYKHPLLGKPADLIEVNLGDFGIVADKNRFFARVAAGKMAPYFAREKIEKEVKAPVLMWVDNPVDLFILQIQGSGRVLLDDGKQVKIGYAASNEKPFTSIGKVMIEKGFIKADDATMPNIRKWLLNNPKKAKSIMRENQRYIFFKKTKEHGPFGAMGIPLTPKRSMAVDTVYIPLGVPLWLDTTDAKGQPLQRLMLAQDIGSAIKGPVRGDFFWGFGDEAFENAGAMKSGGTYYVLIPKR